MFYFLRDGDERLIDYAAYEYMKCLKAFDNITLFQSQREKVWS